MMLPFHLPIYPQCLVNWLPILLSALYNESSEVQLCINPKTQTAHSDSYRWTPLDIIMGMYSCVVHEISLTRAGQANGVQLQSSK